MPLFGLCGCGAIPNAEFVQHITLLGEPLSQPSPAGQVLIKSYDWIPTIGLSASFRLDGLSLLFSQLILVIGLLVVLYAHYYLSAAEGREVAL